MKSKLDFKCSAVFLFFLIVACKKSKFLSTPPNSSLITVSSISDCQALLDNDEVMNGYGNSGYPSLGEVGCDDYYVSNSQYNLYSNPIQQAVTWSKAFSYNTDPDWDLPYRTILYSNAALAELNILDKKPLSAWNNAYASALFFRAFAYYSLSQIFCAPYDSSTAASTWGLPLRMEADVNEKLNRSKIGDTYDRIILDLNDALRIPSPDFPSSPPQYATRPSKAACYGLLSRVFLSVGNYAKALTYSDSCLQLSANLIQYDTITARPPFPFHRNNPEAIFLAAYYGQGPSQNFQSYVDSNLIGSYMAGDLRKTLFFTSDRYFVGRYDESGYNFCGLATDEMYLTRAECYARIGDKDKAMNDLNTLLVARWLRNSYVPLTAIDAKDALFKILSERRKELLYRGLRWTDLRRLNKDSLTSISLMRSINGQNYYLSPNDPKYVYPIPPDVIGFNPGMPQNDR